MQDACHEGGAEFPAGSGGRYGSVEPGLGAGGIVTLGKVGSCPEVSYLSQY